MTDKKYHKLVNNLFLEIEDNLNSYINEIDIDYEIQNNIMTIMFENKSVIIINKQESLKQIWLATSENGHHFCYDNNQWICNRSNKNFWEILKNACIIQSNQKLILKIKKKF
ncbi:iron donor protein CyaY [Buchnera aphidicola (Muscaphis stroyani)]|uniref:Iron-sulfur cluster assembly protein CyaY n=1 Tax=Buchnera aphidicola (Muscaphis stroyani) TaxID=1241869 RepID=A0A4D6YFU2_9GAMM|nr:iron donor protein CyaY [Buchnera aphidicola]QCI24618.1 iron donor protein CyaY [Buchnera aphidicola (Muscaphis stroyani)]